MNDALKGRWSYRSFRHDPIVLKDGAVEGEPELAAPWASGGVVDATTDGDGKVSGTLTFGPGIVLDVSGRVVPASGKTPMSVELIGAGLGSVNRLKGWFIPGSDHVVGTIMCTAHDLGKQPNGTAGPFVLIPLRD